MALSAVQILWAMKHCHTVTQDLQRKAVRIVIGSALVATICVMLLVLFSYRTYQREQRIARKKWALGGIVVFEDKGPSFVHYTLNYSDRTGIFHRVQSVTLNDKSVPLDTIAELGLLTNVGFLDLSSTELTDAGLEQLKGLPRLGWLYIRGNRITDAGMEHLKQIPSLERLVLDGNRVTDAGLEHVDRMTGLSDLSIEQTQVTDVGLGHLTSLTKLRSLVLDRVETTTEGRSKLRKALPNCRITPTP